MTRALFALIASADVRAVALALLLVLSVPAGLVSLTSTATAQEGPVEISTVDELQDMQDDLSANYVLVDEIDASGTEDWNGGDGFVPVGNMSDPFTGSFNGDNHTISGLHVDTAEEDGYGLFGQTDNSTISDVTIEGAYISGDAQAAGVLAGQALSGTSIENVNVSGNVDNPTGSPVGGLVGALDGSEVHNSESHATVSGEQYTGGLVGATYGDTETRESYSTGDVTGGDGYDVGGLVGSHNSGLIIDSYALGNVFTGDADAGGFTGGTYSTVETSFSTGTVTSESGDVGGFTAYADNNINDSYWDTESSGINSSDGDVTGLTTDQMTGEEAEEYMVGFDFEDTWQLSDGYANYEGGLTVEEFTQKYRLHDFTDTFNPEDSQVVIETPSGDPVDVDQFGPENRAEVELEHLEVYRITVTNQDGDKYVWGERNATKPIEIEVGGETSVIGDLDTIFIGSGSDIENADDGYTWVDRDPGSGDFNQPPIAMFEPDPYAPIVDETVTFDASGSSDVDGEVVSYDWTFSDGSSATGEVVDKSFSENGTHDVELTVEDDEGGTATWEMGIYVAESEDDTALPPEPVLSIQPDATPTGELVTFDASGSYGLEGEIVEYNWQIGSVEREGEVVDESFGGAGIKEVKLTVVDENGAYQSVRGEVIVYEEIDEESFMAVGPPLEPGDGILPGSLTGLGFVLLVGTVATGGLFATDQRTSITVPKWAYALPAGATVFMVSESVSPGVLTLPIMRALDVVGPLLIIGALAIVYLLFRGWRDARAADRIQSLQNR
ncbi:PKD domain-containing protein [Halomontanus rarus]|uniref:PKD domain-containing protein n=1 Tax=Halomontanus rarus TaxID=3034020 RepID=UPI0023E83330|nr:PKD domain-containing protein [Halovivax sp. TS33]